MTAGSTNPGGREREVARRNEKRGSVGGWQRRNRIGRAEIASRPHCVEGYRTRPRAGGAEGRESAAGRGEGGTMGGAPPAIEERPNDTADTYFLRAMDAGVSNAPAGHPHTDDPDRTPRVECCGRKRATACEQESGQASNVSRRGRQAARRE